MMNAPVVIALLAAALSVTGIRGEAGEVTLASVPQQISRANPDLRAARFMSEEARARHLGAGRLMNPEIELSGRRMTEGREGGISVGLMQKFPVTARLRLERAVTAAQIAAAEAEVADKQRMLVAEAEGMTIKILSMRAQIGIAENQAALADKMAELSTARAAANELAIEASQMRLEARLARTSIRRMQAEIAGMTESLKPMIGLRATEQLEVTGVLPPAGIPSSQRPGDDRPDIQAALHRVAAAGQSVNLAKAKKWEDLSGGIMVDRARSMDMPEGLENETMVGVRLSIPLPFWNKNQGEVAEASAMQARAVAEVDALRLKAAGEAAAARKEMQRLLPFLTESTDQLLPLAKKQIELVRDAYSNNKASVQDVLRARDRLFMVEMNITEALRDFHLARVRLKAALGMSPSR
jgi:outer membrane protein, heavy metal efflux system